jgi:hypothetical protein
VAQPGRLHGVAEALVGGPFVVVRHSASSLTPLMVIR